MIILIIIIIIIGNNFEAEKSKCKFFYKIKKNIHIIMRNVKVMII
jgi:hypothetical protein